MTEESNPIDRTAQKIAFARRYFITPNDSIIHAAKVLGNEAVENPMLAINFGNDWPFDPIVIDEVERLKNETKAKGEYEAQAYKSYEMCMKIGEPGAAVRFLTLAATIAGHIQKSVSGRDVTPNSEGHEEDFLAAIVDPDNRRDEFVDQEVK